MQDNFLLSWCTNGQQFFACIGKNPYEMKNVCARELTHRDIEGH